MQTQILEADVLVVGGGSAGCTAAIKAQENLPKGRVILLDKAHVKRSGAIALEMDGQVIRDPSPDRGMVFQHHALFPWKTVLDNVAFALKMKGVRYAERRDAALQLLKLVGLSGFESHYPAQLSGGMQQRVGIARVLINRPRVVLMDEPFGALDAQTRLHMQELLLQVWEQFRTTVVFVTHDIDEVLLLADRIVILSNRPGEIKAEVRVPFERPRHTDILTSLEFTSLKKNCFHLIREEGLKVLSRPSPVAAA